MDIESINHIIEVRDIHILMNEINILYKESMNEIEHFQTEMNSILISEAEEVKVKKKGAIKLFLEKIGTIFANMWKGLINIIRIVMKLLTKPFYLVFGVKDPTPNKQDGQEDVKTESDKYERVFRRTSGLSANLSKVLDMKEMTYTGIESLFPLEDIYNKLISMAVDGSVSDDITTNGNSSAETIRRKKEMFINDSKVMDDNASLDKSNFTRLAQHHSEIMKDLVEFANAMKKIITTEVIDYDTSELRSVSDIESSIIDSLTEARATGFGSKFQKYLDDKKSKYIHTLRDFANAESDIVTGMTLNISTTTFSQKEALYYSQIELISTLLENNSISEKAIEKFNELIGSGIYSKKTESEIKESLNKISSKLKSDMDEVSLMEAISEVKNLTGIINSENNIKEAFTMTKDSNTLVSMDKKDIFKSLDYKVNIQTLPLQKVTGAFNTIFKAPLNEDTIGKSLNLFNDDFIKEVIDNFTKDYLSPIMKLSSAISEDISKVKVVDGNITPIAVSGARPIKDKQLKASRFLNTDDGIKLNAIVAESVKNLLTGMKDDITTITGQVLDIERHIRLSRISRVNAGLALYLSYFTNLLLSENEYIIAMKEIEKDSSDEQIKKVLFDSIRNRKAQYAKLSI